MVANVGQEKARAYLFKPGSPVIPLLLNYWVRAECTLGPLGIAIQRFNHLATKQPRTSVWVLRQEMVKALNHQHR